MLKIPIMETPGVNPERQYRALDLCLRAVTSNQLENLVEVVKEDGDSVTFLGAFFDNPEDAIFVTQEYIDRVLCATVQFFSDAYSLRKDLPLPGMVAHHEQLALSAAYRRIQKASMTS